MGSAYIFSHPEKAFSYRMLTKFGKLAPPARFELTAAPRGQFLDANQLFERFGNMPPRLLESQNELMLRAYLRNYKQSKELVPYVIGPFNIMGAFRLGPNNFFSSGVVALAQSVENPKVVLELVFPAEEKNVGNLERMLLTGLDLKLAKTLDLTAVVSARIMPDGRLSITAVPLLYGSYTSSDATGSFSLEPPASLNVAAGLPVLNQAAIDKAVEHYAAYLGHPGKAGESSLMRVQPTEAVRPESVPVARAEAVTPVAPRAEAVSTNLIAPRAEAVKPSPSPAPTAIPVARAVPVTRATNAPPTPTPAAELQPFAAATPATIAATTSREWTVYQPGLMPRGKLVNIDDARGMAGRNSDGLSYIAGDFEVSASGSNRAVLRGKRGQQKIRIIVDYPPGSTPPAKGDNVARDAQRPFQITSVEKGADGQINVFAREVTKP